MDFPLAVLEEIEAKLSGETSRLADGLVNSEVEGVKSWESDLLSSRAGCFVAQIKLFLLITSGDSSILEAWSYSEKILCLWETKDRQQVQAWNKGDIFNRRCSIRDVLCFRYFWVLTFNLQMKKVFCTTTTPKIIAVCSLCWLKNSPTLFYKSALPILQNSPP